MSGDFHQLNQVSTLEGNPDIEVRSAPLANCHVLRYNTRHPHMQHRLLRHALSLSIDRALLVETLWGGRAELMRGLQFPEYGELYNPDRPISPYDPEQARSLLEESTYDGEILVMIWASPLTSAATRPAVSGITLNSTRDADGVPPK